MTLLLAAGACARGMPALLMLVPMPVLLLLPLNAGARGLLARAAATWYKGGWGAIVMA